MLSLLLATIKVNFTCSTCMHSNGEGRNPWHSVRHQLLLGHRLRHIHCSSSRKFLCTRMSSGTSSIRGLWACNRPVHGLEGQQPKRREQLQERQLLNPSLRLIECWYLNILRSSWILNFWFSCELLMKLKADDPFYSHHHHGKSLLGHDCSSQSMTDNRMKCFISKNWLNSINWINNVHPPKQWLLIPILRKILARNPCN